MSESSPIYQSPGYGPTPTEIPAAITGETTPAQRFLTVVFFAVIGAFSLETVIAAIVVGIKSPRYFLLAIPAVLFAVLFFLLWFWHKGERDTMSPKWGRIIVVFGIVVVLFLIAVNIAVWSPPDPATECHGVWISTLRTCMGVCDHYWQCLRIGDGTCHNCSELITELGSHLPDATVLF